MTWDEFKAYVDKQIAEQGADGGIDVWYINVTDPEESFTDVVVNRRQPDDDKSQAELSVDSLEW